MWKHYQPLLIPLRTKYLRFQFISTALQLVLEVFEQGEEGVEAPQINLAEFF